MVIRSPAIYIEISLSLRFENGCDLAEFKEYYRKTMGRSIGSTEERLITENPKHLIVWKVDDSIIGHAIWHASNTKVHPDGTPRAHDDRRILEKELKVRGRVHRAA